MEVPSGSISGCQLSLDLPADKPKPLLVLLSVTSGPSSLLSPVQTSSSPGLLGQVYSFVVSGCPLHPREAPWIPLPCIFPSQCSGSLCSLLSL